MNAPTNVIKPAHRRHILAIDAAYVNESMELQDGFTEAKMDRFGEDVNNALVIERRYELENDPTRRQILPYLVIVQDMKDGTEGVWRYRRTDSGGEAALHNKISIGAGGHVELHQVVSSLDHELDLEETIYWNLEEEVREELKIIDDHGVKVFSGDLVKKTNPNFKFVGFIADDRDEVGTKHLGCVCLLMLPRGYTVMSNEDDLADISLVSFDSLEAGNGSEFTLEGWTQLLVSKYLETQGS